ncbi:MAG: transaldolase [Burkholderiales bacterium PBB3]|nr:MAG: transaldolase [Burkholderiales bacterium PBB3]
MNQLEQLKQVSKVVADTGDIQLAACYQPQDATTNPSLILKAAQSAEYAPLILDTVRAHSDLSAARIMDAVIVRFGLEILQLIPGRVSSEIDARLSFDVPAMLEQARHLIALYKMHGVAPERVLIKIAATWEGIQAARILAKEGIKTNLTLVFALPQAIACADAGVQLISPFVGRIYDWHRKSAGAAWDESAMAGANDPGVQSVKEIFTYYKRHAIATEIMAASFRNTGQILALAGCDLLTISPALLEQLQAASGAVERNLSLPSSTPSAGARIALTESEFRRALNRDAMATEKLAEGIRLFEQDTDKLEAIVQGLLLGGAAQ